MGSGGSGRSVVDIQQASSITSHITTTTCLPQIIQPPLHRRGAWALLARIFCNERHYWDAPTSPDGGDYAALCVSVLDLCFPLAFFAFRFRRRLASRVFGLCLFGVAFTRKRVCGLGLATFFGFALGAVDLVYASQHQPGNSCCDAHNPKPDGRHWHWIFTLLPLHPNNSLYCFIVVIPGSLSSTSRSNTGDSDKRTAAYNNSQPAAQHCLKSRNTSHAKILLLAITPCQHGGGSRVEVASDRQLCFSLFL